MEKYIPDMYQESIFKVNYDKLKEIGIKTILFDLDNTILEYKNDIPSMETKELLEKLTKDFELIIFSNGSKKRVNKIIEIFGIEGYYRVKKPCNKSFKKLLIEKRYNENEVAIIGDQMMTDILGGNGVGITTILVNPINSNEPIWTKINRFFEHKQMRKLREKSLFTKGRFYE